MLKVRSGTTIKLTGLPFSNMNSGASFMSTMVLSTYHLKELFWRSSSARDELTASSMSVLCSVLLQPSFTNVILASTAHPASSASPPMDQQRWKHMRPLTAAATHCQDVGKLEPMEHHQRLRCSISCSTASFVVTMTQKRKPTCCLKSVVSLHWASPPS